MFVIMLTESLNVCCYADCRQSHWTFVVMLVVDICFIDSGCLLV